MEKYIEWDLKNNPDFFKKPQTGRYVDTGVLRHVIANVNCPEGLSDADFFLALNAVAEEVDYIPRADVAPVVHGRWAPSEGNPGFLVCSACGDCYVVDEWADGKKWMYCPNCGAKIDGKDEEA